MQFSSNQIFESRADIIKYSKMATRSRLTIYSQSGHIVQKYPGGRTESAGIAGRTESSSFVRIALPKSADVGSIVAIDVNGQIIPFDYAPESTLSSSLTDRQTGDKVEAMVVKDNQTTTGKIISLDANNVTLANATEITTIRKYDRISVNPTAIQSEGLLFLDSAQPFTVSYLISNINWNCLGTILVDKSKNEIYLRLTGSINNNTESDFVADTVLVSGDVFQRPTRSSAKMFMAAALPAPTSSPMSSPSPNTKLLEDYTKYDVGSKLITTKNIVELGTSIYPMQKIYVHQTDGDFGNSSLGANSKAQVTTWGYHFEATGFIPGCSVNVYAIDGERNIDAFLGATEIEESQMGDDIDIMLGETTMLQCRSLVTISDVVEADKMDKAKAAQYQLPTQISTPNLSKDGAWHIITESLQVEIINHNPEPVTLILKHYVGNKHIIAAQCQAYKQRKRGFIEWYFVIPARSESGVTPTSPVASPVRKDTFSCQIVTAEFR